MNKEIKQFRVNIKKAEMDKVEFLMKHFSKDSIQDLFRSLLDKVYSKEKEILLKYGKSPAGEKKLSISNKLDEIRKMSDTEATGYFLSLGYEDFHGDKPVNPDDFPSTNKYNQRRMIRSAIMTLPDGTREFVKHYFDELEPNVIKDTYDTSYDLEKLLKQLLKLGLIK